MQSIDEHFRPHIPRSYPPNILACRNHHASLIPLRISSTPSSNSQNSLGGGGGDAELCPCVSVGAIRSETVWRYCCLTSRAVVSIRAFSSHSFHMMRSRRWRTATRRMMYPWLAANAMKRVRETMSHVGRRVAEPLVLASAVMRYGSWKRNTRAELVRAESQERKERQFIHGPMVSVRIGSGRRKCVTSLNASERNSTILFSRAITNQKINYMCGGGKCGRTDQVRGARWSTRGRRSRIE